MIKENRSNRATQVFWANYIDNESQSDPKFNDVEKTRVFKEPLESWTFPLVNDETDGNEKRKFFD